MTVNLGHLTKDIKGDDTAPKWTLENTAITTPTVMARGVLQAADLLTQRYFSRWIVFANVSVPQKFIPRIRNNNKNNIHKKQKILNFAHRLIIVRLPRNQKLPQAPYSCSRYKSCIVGMVAPSRLSLPIPSFIDSMLDVTPTPGLIHARSIFENLVALLCRVTTAKHVCSEVETSLWPRCNACLLTMRVSA